MLISIWRAWAEVEEGRVAGAGAAFGGAEIGVEEALLPPPKDGEATLNRAVGAA